MVLRPEAEGLRDGGPARGGRRNRGCARVRAFRLDAEEPCEGEDNETAGRSGEQLARELQRGLRDLDFRIAEIAHRVGVQADGAIDVRYLFDRDKAEAFEFFCAPRHVVIRHPPHVALAGFEVFEQMAGAIERDKHLERVALHRVELNHGGPFRQTKENRMEQIKKCAPTFADTARKALGKAASSLADNREDLTLFLGMTAWIVLIAVLACI